MQRSENGPADADNETNAMVKTNSRTDSEVAADELAPTLAKRLAIGRDNHQSHHHPLGNDRNDDNNNSHGGDDSLAPTLAKHLAIDGGCGPGHTDPDDLGEVTTTTDTAGKKKRGPQSSSLSSSTTIKRSLEHAAASTSCCQSTTTSGGEEENSNTYYTGRGAGVCSALLHVMVQIDARIREAPQYLFQVLDQTLLSNQRRRVDPFVSESQTAIRIHRGPFVCTARLKLIKKVDKESLVLESKPPGDAGDRNLLNEGTKHGTDSTTSEEPTPCSSVSNKISEDILEAAGVGGTKREAKHIASAKLLALLFPECETMAEVKAAAEAARERYAASRASKHQQHQNGSTGSSRRERQSIDDEESSTDKPNRRRRRPAYVLPNPTLDHPVPSNVLDDLKSICLSGEPVSHAATMCSQSASEAEAERVSTHRQITNRRKQLDAQVDSALHAFNEQDEEGRSLPAGREVTADDVGRAVLRRATAEEEDLVRIEKLFLSSLHDCSSKRTGNYTGYLPSTATNKAWIATSNGIDEEKEPPSCTKSTMTLPHALLNSLSSSRGRSIVLLLCRAIAPHEDPPLGCALLTLGFSMESGRLLRIVKIANEPHCPKNASWNV